MGMFRNTQKVSYIVYEPKTTHNLCPLGQLYCDELSRDGSKPELPHYTNHFTITLVPGDFICDYIEVEKWIREKINNETLVIEDAVSMLFNYMMETYKPRHLIVESHVEDAMHGVVTVVKESEDLMED